jgi:hypothetical protein
MDEIHDLLMNICTDQPDVSRLIDAVDKLNDKVNGIASTMARANVSANIKLGGYGPLQKRDAV